MGDYNGIGPEVILKTFEKHSFNHVLYIAAGEESVFNFYRHRFNLDIEFNLIKNTKEAKKNVLNIINCCDKNLIDVEFGSITRSSGKAAMITLEKALNICLDMQGDAIVTAPISKESIQLAGYHYPGHTEFLAEKTDTSDYLMMLIYKNLRVALATIHVPISKVSSLISESLIAHKLEILHNSLKFNFNISKPDIAVLGLNPHAGDGGVIGKEELEIIVPALNKANDNSICVSGPYSADGFFGSGDYKKYDAILAMYHDQGLIPFKTLSFGKGVNFTAGIPVIRTSPDHGTAFNIAGMNKANYHSFTSAVELAIELIINQNKSAVINE